MVEGLNYIKRSVFFMLAAVVASSTLSIGMFGGAEVDAVGECIVTEKLVNPCRPWLGANAGNYPTVPTGSQSQILGHEDRIGRQLDVVHLYHSPGSSPLSATDKYFATRPNTILNVNWKPATTWSNANGTNATVNAQIDATADSIKSISPTKIMLTIFHEPENDVSGGATGCSSYSGTSGTPADYRAMWQNVRSRFDAKGVTNVVYVMNYMGFSNWDCMVDDLWPGNELVDWVVYDPYSETTSWSTTIGRFYNFLSTSSNATNDYLSKPWGLGEWSVWRNATQAHTYAYYDAARASIAANEFPKLKMFNVFDNTVVTPGTSRIAYGSNDVYDQVEVDHYKALANDPVFVGTWSTAPDVIAPVVQIISPTDFSTVSGSVTVTANIQDAVGAESASLLVDGIAVATKSVVGQSSTSFAWDSTTVVEGAHTLQVTARDAAGNTGFSNVVNVIVQHPIIDTTPPSAPANMRVTENTYQRVSVAWDASTDNVGVSHYQVVRDGVVLATNVTTTQYVDSTVQPNTTYRYYVQAVDAAGNTSLASNEVSVLTPPVPDTQAPTTPTKLTATVNLNTVNLTWRSSTDNVGVQGYYVYQNGILIGSTANTSYSVAGLTKGTYKFSVRAYDAAGNVSSLSNNAQVTIK